MTKRNLKISGQALQGLRQAQQERVLPQVIAALQEIADGGQVGEPLRSGPGLLKSYIGRSINDIFIEQDCSCIYELQVNCDINRVGDNLVDLTLSYGENDAFSLYGAAVWKGSKEAKFSDLAECVRGGLSITSIKDTKDCTVLNLSKKDLSIRYICYSR